MTVLIIISMLVDRPCLMLTKNVFHEQTDAEIDFGLVLRRHFFLAQG